MEKKKLIIFGVVAYVVTAAISYFLFSAILGGKGGKLITSTVPQPKPGKEGQLQFDDRLPKTEMCPLNGAMYSKQQKAWWEKHRPLGVMIENHEESRPQSGLSAADVVYEAVAEGGITRFLAVFYCQDAGIIGPVRSARTYFLDFISEYGSYPLYTHVGGANTPGPADALSQIESYGWQAYNDMNQFSIGFPTFWRDYERLGHNVATEHTMYSTTEKLWKEGEKRKLTNVDEDNNSWDEEFVPFTFKEDEALSARPATQVVEFDFWKGYGEYTVEWSYDKATNSYLRKNGGAVHSDKDNGKPLAAKNVVVLFMKESRANDGYDGNLHMLYGTKGTGKAIVFQDGKRIDGTWTKKDRESRMKIVDSKGAAVKFNKGLIWFEILPIGNIVTVN